MDDISIKMQALWKKMRLRFVNADSIVRLIYINIALFLLMRLLTVTSDLLGQLHYYTFYLSLPSSFSVLLTRPWTLFTYFFIHNDFMHLAMNMLCLYWFGSLFSRFFTSQQLVATYILGGIAGGVVYITAYHLFPFLSYGFLVGASASILSLLIAVAYRAPYYRLHLLLIGEVSLKTVAFVWVILDLLSITQENAGTHWAHFGGIAYGFFFAYLLHKGTDITAYPQMIWHNLKTLFGKKEKSTRVKANYQDVRFESDGDYNARKAREKQEIDLILDKIKRSGYSALSEEEKRKLFEAGESTMSILGKLLNGGAFLINLALAFLLLISIYSPYINPNTAIISAFLGITFPFWMLGNLFFVLYWLVQHRWPFLLSLSVLLLSSHEIRNYFPLHRPTSPLPENTIKLLSYNCEAFLDLRKKSENNIVSYINRCDADIVCLQEYAFSPSGKQSGNSQLKKYFPQYPYVYFVPRKEKSKENWGIACLSRYPITQIEQIHYPSQSNYSVAFTLQVSKKKEIILINNHLESNHLNHEDKELYSHAITTLNPESIKEVRSNLIGKLARSWRIRAVQADSIRNFIDRHPDKEILVCGDFNDTQVSYAYRTIRGNLQDAYGSSGRGIGISYHKDYFFFRIDHIFHSSGIRAYNASIDPVKYSDHYPLSCYLQIEGAKPPERKRADQKP